MGSCQSKSTPQLGIHPNNSMNNGGGSKNMPPSKSSTMIGTSGTGIANAIAGAHAAATAAVDLGRHDHDDMYDEDDEFESNYYEIKKTGRSTSSLMVDTNMDKNKKDRGLLLRPEDEVDDDDGTDDDIPKVQIYTTRNYNSSRNSVFFSPLGEQTAATELPTPLSTADGEDNNYSHTTTYSPPQSAIKSSRISINRHVSGRGHNIHSHDKVIKDEDNSVVRDEGFEVIRRLVDYDSPDRRGQAHGGVEEEMTGLSIVPTSPVPSPTTNEIYHLQEQRDDDEDDIMTNTETDERSVLLSTTTTTTRMETTLAASYCAYDYEIDCDDSAELPPLHIDDEAIKRIRERLSYLEDEDEDDDDDNQSGDDGDEPKLSPDDEAIRRIRERLACLDDDDKEKESCDNDEGRLLPVLARNNSRQLSEIHGDDSQSKVSPDSPALVDLQRKNQASSKMVPYSPRPPTSKRSKVQAVDDEEEEEDVSNVNRLVDDLNRVTPLVAPPRDNVVSFLKDTTESQSSVDPKAIASFNKLKVQVELAAKADEKQKRDKKLQDRRADVNGYKNLWNDYQVIQEQMKETKINDTSRHTPSESLGAVSPQSQQQLEEKRQQQNRPGPCDGLLLHDPSTWFVDFRAMSALNHLYDDSDEEDGDDYTDDDSDEEDGDGRSSADGFSRHSSYTSRTSMSRLSHSGQMSQQQLFQRIAVERKRRSGAYSVGSTKGDVSHSLSANNRPSLSINDDDEDKVGGNLSAENSLSIKYTKSTINGIILPVVSPSGSDDIEVAFDEALEQNNEKTPVNIEDQQREGSLLQNGTSMEDDGPVLNAPTPVASNQAVRPSFSPEYSLPSVKLSIDNNSTGEVRWRNFPVSHQPTTRRKLLFEDEDEVENATEAPKDEQEGRQQKRDDDDEHADPLIDNEKARKQIAFLSADQFLRMALIRELLHKSHHISNKILLLHDPSTWFVDFRAMSALNHLYDDYSDEDDGDDYTDDDSDEEDDDGRGSANGFSRHSSYTSRTSMSRLSHSDQMSQQQLFQRIAVERKRRSGAYSVGSTKDDVSHSVNNRPSLIINDDDEGKVGGNLSAEKSLSIKYTKSTINGVILPLVSPSGSDDIEVAFDEALEQDNEKTPVNIEDQQREGSLLQNDTSMEDDGPVLNAPTPVASNQAVRPSFSPEYSLPSVKLSIDGNSTGEVRWRNFPVSDQPTTRRKLLFEDEDEVETATEAPKDEQEGRQQKRDDDDENADPLIDNEKARKQIAFLSADQFLRMAL
eukprot:CAMPEP_0113485316 /NCGR_PEP_ID=MMETSP0014_2-20120614/24420_1 /TAXON_ID=2857 /ORGANISM="Nitzschia sp." /LENGTH=1255 /DNA_ID=CAMNT_0000378957 /DNA_START=84 /DNA_END=3850 /DNA_ORIENTATION=+ /assembly_acc=CAM_ASM_000159